MALRQNQAGFLRSVPSGGCSRAHLVLFQVNEAPISEVNHLVCAPTQVHLCSQGGLLYPDLTLPQKAPFYGFIY